MKMVSISEFNYSYLNFMCMIFSITLTKTLEPKRKEMLALTQNKMSLCVFVFRKITVKNSVHSIPS